jgi:hypothetical protein
MSETLEYDELPVVSIVNFWRAPSDCLPEKHIEVLAQIDRLPFDLSDFPLQYMPLHIHDTGLNAYTFSLRDIFRLVDFNRMTRFCRLHFMFGTGLEKAEALGE